jgi:hypothetical protein
VDSYSARGLAKIFILADEPQRALNVISAIPTEQVNHWLLYRKTEAQKALNLPEAAQTARDALSKAKDDPKAQRHLAAYYDLSSRCLEPEDLSGAIEHAKAAIDHSTDGKYRHELQARLLILSNDSPQNN